MLRLREILRRSFLARFFVHLFIFNFFTGQCLAMMPAEVLVDNFSSNVRSLFSTFNEIQDSLGLVLTHEKETNRYSLEAVKFNDFGDFVKQELSSEIRHDEHTGEDFLDFGYGFMFSVIDGALYFSDNLNGFSGYFQTNTDIFLSNLHFNRSFSISANTIQVQNKLTANNSLSLVCNKLLNQGTTFSPFLSIRTNYLENFGSILGSRVSIESDILNCQQKSSISGSEITDITAKEKVKCVTSSIVGKNLQIRTAQMDISNGSEISGQVKFDFSGNKFIIDKDSQLTAGENARFMTYLFHNEGGRLTSYNKLDIFASIFLNQGTINAPKTDIFVTKENALFGPSPLSSVIEIFAHTFPDKRLGSFANIGEINANTLSVIAEMHLLNRGVLGGHASVDLDSGSDFVNEGHIIQSGLATHVHSKIHSRGKIFNREGIIDFVTPLSVDGESFDNTHGTLKAKQLSMQLALDENEKFRDNEREHINLQSETNAHFQKVQDYLRMNRSTKKSNEHSSGAGTTSQTSEESSNKEESSNQHHEESKPLSPEIGYLINTGGIIEVLRNLDINGSGAIYNAEEGRITAKDNISLNIYGRLLNQLGSRLSAHRIAVGSQGRIFNTSGSSIEGLMSFRCDGLENGTGAKILGGLNVISHTSIYNFGEIRSIEDPLQMVTDFSIQNYGSIASDEEIVLTGRSAMKNIGRIASKKVKLHIGSPDDITTNSLPFAIKNGSIAAEDLIFECFAATPIFSSVSLSDLVRNAGIEAASVKFLFPNAIVENLHDNILNFNTLIFAKEFRNLALLKSRKKLTISTSEKFTNAASDNSLNPSSEQQEVPTFRLINDYDIGKQKELNALLEPNDVDCLPVKAKNNAMIISDGDLSIFSDDQIKNTGTMETKGHLSLKGTQIQHGWAYESIRHESLPELEFDYGFMEAQPGYIRAEQGAEITAAKFLNTFGTIDIIGGLVSNNPMLFLNYAGDISVLGETRIVTPFFANLVGTVRTNRADKRYWSLEFCNTNQANINVLNGSLRIDSPHAINSGSFLYGQNGVFLNGATANGLISVFDIASKGFSYTRMFSVNEYNRGQYSDKILGMGYTSTGLGAIIRAELNEKVTKSVISASVSSSKQNIIDGYNNLKSNGIIHGASVRIKTGDGKTELGDTGDAVLPSVSGFAKSVDLFPYISALAQEGQFELAEGTDSFIFKSRSNGMKIPFALIGEPTTDFSKLKLPFSLEVLEVMLLKQTQKSLGTGYLADMPTFLDAAKVAHSLIVGGKSAEGTISILSEEQATHGLFFKQQKIGDYDVLIPELRLSPESVHAALLNPAGATVAQSNRDANVIIDTDGFLHATASIHADDSIKIKAKRGALFETTTYDAWAITQNVTATTSRGGVLGMDSDTEYHKLTEWHQIRRAREPMLATTTRGDFIIILPDDKETTEFRGMFADIAGNFEVHGGNCVLSPLEVAGVVPCPGLFEGGANRISTMLPVFLKTALKSNGNFLADVRVFKNTGSKIEAMGDIVINATDRIEFNTQTRKFTLAEGMEVDEGTFTTKVSSRKVEDVVFNQPEVKAGGKTTFNSDTVHLTGNYESERDIEIKARLAELASVLDYGTDQFESKASNMFSHATYDRFATFARVAPTVFRTHGDFITDIVGLYSEHSIQKSCHDERIAAGSIDSAPLRAHEVVIEHSSSSGFNFFIPTSVVAPVCDGNIRGAIDAFWRESSLLNSTYSLLHSKRGADIAANGISTALSAYSSIKTVLDFGAGGAASLFGIGNFGFYHTESKQNTTHDFTIASTTMASGNIDWRARNGDIHITHRLAEAEGDQHYTAAGRIEVNPGEDAVQTDGHTVSSCGTFNIFTGGASFGINGSSSSSSTTEYMASGFRSKGTNVFRAGNEISIVIPQIDGSRNVFDAMFVRLENKANEREAHSSTHGATISTSPLETAAMTAGANFGASNSHDTYLNDAYVRGAVDFAHSQVRNQGCLVMDITNAGASYEYVPMEEMHESSSFAIGVSGLDLSSPDAFAYSLGRDLASAATSAGVGMLASEAGLGGFVSSLAASFAGAYVNSEIMPQMHDAEHRPTGLGSTGTVEMEHNGYGFRSTQIDFDQDEFNHVIDQVKAKVFDEALDKGLPTQEAVQIAEQQKQKLIQDLNTEKAKVEETSDFVEQTGKDAVEEIKAEIGETEAAKLANKQPFSKETRAIVAKHFKSAAHKLRAKKNKLNFEAPLHEDPVAQASRETQNQLIDAQLLVYDNMLSFLSTEQPRLRRSNSSDNLLQDTYIRQGQRAFGIVAGSFVDIAHEADTMTYEGYVETQRSRLPAEAQNNPEVLAKLGVSYAFYKGAAKIGHGISALDDATGNVVSGAMHKLGEGFEWLGTHTRRFVRDDIGLGQRVGQNVGDATQLIAEFFAPGTVIKGIGSASKIVGASKFRAAIGERFGLFKGDISGAKIGLNWEGAIGGETGYGMAFENWLAKLPEFSGIRLPKNFKTFDFWDRTSGRAVSAKTLNTNTPARLLNPDGIYGTLKGYVDKTLDFTGYSKGMVPPESLDVRMIRTREIQLGIPANTGKAQMEQIQRAIDYGRL
ncbi:MAG: hypothetical protein IJT36_03660, partial [Alphaproteobacteria bacterium]|nr:hypothetical protein [Alphaproteobacteria bacterium]